ncbi:MAG: ribose 5-phosphate isomerase B [Acidobacteria bacterium]|jgi:ribose 5-phosphate isomerase B|nr:ribose 5-phosphate isomerase B [Acidobacteriota bacterium]
MKIYLSSDHAAFELKEKIKKYLLDNQYSVEDMGTHSTESSSWVEYGAAAAREVSQDPENARAIIICGSGIGMSMVSNKFKNVRAAVCNDLYTAEMSRKHNNANVLNIGSRIVAPELALRIVDKWLNTEFEGNRHQLRIDQLSNIEEKNFK